MGEGQYGIGKTENYHYGKGVNKADTFAKTGMKEKMLEEAVINKLILVLEANNSRVGRVTTKKNRRRKKGTILNHQQSNLRAKAT